MKILLNSPRPFALAHGGLQIQIEQTEQALKQIGVDVEYTRWYDERQTGDLIHYFGRMPVEQVQLAQAKGIKVVMAELLTTAGSRSPRQLLIQRQISRAYERFMPRLFVAPFQWDSYRLADAVVALTPWEGHLMHYLFGAPRERIHIVPNGVEEVFLKSPPRTRGEWLVCTATITERKRVLELAQAAVTARTPVWVIGRAYSETDPYARAFAALAKLHPGVIRFEGAIEDRPRLTEIYRAARGFVLLSSMESLSLSALEAAACECPLLLSDLPRARGTFGEKASYVPDTADTAVTAAALRKFYDAAETLPRPPRPLDWLQVAAQLKALYEQLVKSPAATRPPAQSQT